MAHRVEPSAGLRGRIRVPGDKSISHRAFLINALGTGSCRIRGVLEAEDVAASRALVQALGTQLRREGQDWILEAGPLREPSGPIDCGNSGTTMRLGAGVAVHQPGTAVLCGDASLSRRPMQRIVDPLEALGHSVKSLDGRAPLHVQGGRGVFAKIEPSVASAQVKSAALLAGLKAGVEVVECGPSRDHTEVMLRRMGARLQGLTLEPGPLSCVDVDVPADLSSAAFWIVAALIVPGSELELPEVGTNPTRTGCLDVLTAMGAPSFQGTVRSCDLRGTMVSGTLALRSIDELPILAVAAACASGETVLSDATELRHKESDRIARVVLGLRSMGVEVEERPDGMVVAGGGIPGGGQVDCSGDHRLAMAFAVAGLASRDGVELLHADAVQTSYPSFFADLQRVSTARESR